MNFLLLNHDSVHGKTNVIPTGEHSTTSQWQTVETGKLWPPQLLYFQCHPLDKPPTTNAKGRTIANLISSWWGVTFSMLHICRILGIQAISPYKDLKALLYRGWWMAFLFNQPHSSQGDKRRIRRTVMYLHYQAFILGSCSQSFLHPIQRLMLYSSGW